MTASYDHIRNYLVEELQIPGAAGEPGADLFEAGLDSIGLVDLIAFIEDTYDVALQPADCVSENFRNIRSIADLVAAVYARSAQ